VLTVPAVEVMASVVTHLWNARAQLVSRIATLQQNADNTHPQLLRAVRSTFAVLTLGFAVQPM
jgi:hypothetical protein